MPPEILDLRHFTSADLRPLLDAEGRVWAERMQWDYGSSAEMILRYIDAKILPGYALVESGRVLGYSFFVYEGNKGVIGDLFVHPEARPPSRTSGNGSGSAEPPADQLLTNVIATLQQSPGIHRVEAQLLVHDSGAVAAPFQREGFRRFPRVFMTLPLREELIPRDDTSRFPDLAFRPWSEEDFQGAAAVITAAYRGHIDSDINDQYRSLAGSLRFLNNIVRFPGCGVFDRESSYVVERKDTCSIVSLLLCSRVRDDVGHVTQVATAPELRGRGIAEVLIGKCAKNLMGRGFSALSLTVTEANDRAVQLYRRLRFEQHRVFDAFVWEG